MKWSRRKILVTGGAGFIGSHLVNELLELDATVTVIDTPRSEYLDVWHRKVDHYFGIWRKHGYEIEYAGKGIYRCGDNSPLIVLDLEKESPRLPALMKDQDIVFHLAAVFGGRGFIDTRQSECCSNFAINHHVFSEAYNARVQHVHFASSACVYPPELQHDSEYLLREEDAWKQGWASSDDTYGWTKIMGELELQTYHREKGLPASICRFLTVYGPWEFDTTHAVAALFAKAKARQDPFEVWGSGEQERGFTYVDDIVRGILAAAEKVSDATPVNLGTEIRYKIRQVADLILRTVGHTPRHVRYLRDKPEGPFTRALDLSLAKRLLGWEPKVDLPEGLSHTWASLSESPPKTETGPSST